MNKNEARVLKALRDGYHIVCGNGRYTLRKKHHTSDYEFTYFHTLSYISHKTFNYLLSNNYIKYVLDPHTTFVSLIYVENDGQISQV